MEALSAARRRQADLLRSILPQPFAQLGSPVRGEVYLGKENDAWRVAVYCLKCGPEHEGATPGVFLDVRRTRCASCGVPLARGVSRCSKPPRPRAQPLAQSTKAVAHAERQPVIVAETIMSRFRADNRACVSNPSWLNVTMQPSAKEFTS
jgi:ribosomal protein L37E